MATKKTTNAVKQPIDAAVAAQKETVEAVVKAGTEAATKGYEQALQMTKEQVEKASTAMFKGYDEFSALNKDTIDAYVTSGKIFAKGVESLNREIFSFAQSAMETNVASAKAIFGARNVREMLEVQAEQSRANFDNFVAESTKIAEMSVAVANEAVEPIQARMKVTVEKMLKPIAA